MGNGPTLTFEQYWKRFLKDDKKKMDELKKFGRPIPSGGHVWTGADLIRYFESRKKKPKRKR